LASVVMTAKVKPTTTIAFAADVSPPTVLDLQIVGAPIRAAYPDAEKIDYSQSHHLYIMINDVLPGNRWAAPRQLRE